jgi:hypothetical protein
MRDAKGNEVAVGDTVEYRAVVNVECTPIFSTVVGPADGYPDRILIDCGRTKRAAPYDRDQRIAWPGQIRKA